MKAQLFCKSLLLAVCSFFAVASFAQEEPPTLPTDPENVTDYLPLTLVSFSASSQNSYVQLYWETTNEVNVNNFVVERSIDGRTFQGIASVAGNNQVLNNYSFADNSLTDNTVYYRLKMIDKDGLFTYSFIVTVRKVSSNRLSMYPNPAVNYVTVVHGLPKGKASITVTNSVGVRVQTIVINGAVQQTSFQLNNNVRSGNYVLQYLDDEGVRNISFVKQ